MFEKIKHVIFGRDIELRKRLFRMILLVAQIISFLGIVETIFLVDTPEITIPLVLFFIILGAAMVATLKFGKIDFSAITVGLTLIIIVFPGMFFRSGGIESGATVWFVLELIYVFIMFSGKKLFAFVALCIVMDCLTYGTAYLHPEYILTLSSKKDIYLDVLFSVLATGMAVGGILKFQIKIFEMERSVVLSQKEELEKLSDLKNAFFAGMSHEIRTPINTIIGLNEMILRQETSDTIKEYAENIQMASKMLLSLVNDVLDMSQMEMKKMEIVPVEYQTKEIFEELIDMVRVRIKEKKLDLYVEIDKNLPSVLLGDEKRIKQVLLNILTNAIKYTEKGSVTFSVYAEPAEGNKTCLKISVADTGIGIRKEDLEYLYDTFKRIDEKKNTRIEGSGLGLSITKQLLDLMGGEIKVDSIYTKGSTFTVILEQEVVDDTPIGSIDFMEKKTASTYHYIPSFEAPEARILIVDDNPMNIMVEEELLRDTKMQIDSAQSGTECLKKTKLKYYHVILMDYAMAEMTGEEVLKKLRKQENGLCRESKVILLTAANFSDAKHISRENGFDGFLEKPIMGQQLEKKLLEVLPEDIIEQHFGDSDFENKNLEVKRVLNSRKRKNIYITTDCVCDLPEEYLELFDIKVMYLYIETEHGRFADTKEIDLDNLSQYMTDKGSTAKAVGAPVEEYEEFFAEALTQAEHVLYISMAKYAGKTYETAVAAAKGFDHVHVIDSGHASCGQALIVLLAAQMAMEGYHTHEICEKIEICKGRVETYLMIPSMQMLANNNHDNITKGMAAMFGLLQLHPVISMKRSKSSISGVRGGNLENAWKKFIRSHLKRNKKISPEVIIIGHIGCNAKQLELIKEEVLKCIPFKKVIIQKASFTNASISGLLSIGFAYIKKNEKI